MKKILLTYFLFITLFNVSSQLTYVPDDAFETLIETNFPAASNGNINDNYVLTAGIQNILALGVDGTMYQINDYTGLQDFTISTTLQIYYQNVEVIDLSSYQNLNPPLGSLNVIIQYNNLLKTVILPQKNLQVLIANNPILENIVFQDNNKFSGVNQIASNLSLKEIDISNTAGVVPMSALTVQQNPYLECVKMNNGQCINWQGVGFSLNGNPNFTTDFSYLTCIQVDDPFYSNLSANWGWDFNVIDPTSYVYSTNCSCNLGMEENILGSLTAYPNPTSGNISITFPEELIGNHFTLLSQLGEIIDTNKILNESMQLDTEHLQNGVYFIHVGSKSIGRFVVMR